MLDFVPPSRTWLALFGFLAAYLPVRAAPDWPEYLGGPDRSHYSELKQIDAHNVGQLHQAWEYHTGDFGILEANPIIVGEVLYSVTAKNGVFALDAATGRELWHYHPPGNDRGHLVRGVTYWADGNERRIFFTAGPWLLALDAVHGQPILSFGREGRVSLRSGLGPQAERKPVACSTPGTLVDDLLIMPMWTSEDTSAAPGFIQAFNVRTGNLAWVFRTIPAPGDPGYETWPKDAYKNIDVGSANCWAGMAVDRKRGIIYAGTGSAAPDFWGGHRLGNDLYANCVLALEAKTGRLLWHYQVVHHDLWDRDMPAPPNLVTVRRGGRTIDAVAQVTKAGLVFVFDRVTGEPLFPIHERPVPASTMPGEQAASTQPVPELPAPFTRQTVTVNDVSPFARNHDALVAEVRSARTGSFQPFGRDDTLIMPGFSGGGEWGGAATDPQGILYINANEWPSVGRLKDSPSPEELAHLSRGHRLYALYCSSCHGLDRTGNPLSGFPSLVNVAERRKPEEVVKQIANGSGRMPGFPMLDGAERRAVADYLFGMEKAQDTPDSDAATIEAPAEYQPFQLDGYQKFLDQDGYPGVRPPWGTLTAIDLNTGRTKWRIPLGEFKELTARGIPPTGTENWGGPVVTGSGLLFIAATMDNQIRAFDSATGHLLWQASLPACGQATPSTYEAGGRQYVVVACGGGRNYPAPPGDSYVAFTSPSTRPSPKGGRRRG